MEKKLKKRLLIAAALLTAFAVWTLLVSFVDVRPIGPEGSKVGLAGLNGLVHRLVGVNMALYEITDWLGLLSIATALGFAVLGLCQLIKRKSLLRVDRSILALGGFYIAVFAAYVLFEFIAVNYRPVLIEGRLEASYPSSTTMLTLCVMPTAAMQLASRIKGKALRFGAVIVITAFTVFMVIGRGASGVHWISDIIGGALLSGGLVTVYRAFSE